MDRIETLIIYLTVFFFSSLFFYLGDKKIINVKNKNVCYLIGILVLAVFSSIRGETVGTDYKVYAKDVFTIAQSCDSIGNIFSLSVRYEKIFILLAFFSNKISNDIAVFLFFVQLLNVVPVFIAIYKRRNDISITFSMLIYMLLYYLMSFNAMRQSIAIAFLILGIVCYIDKEYIKTIVSFIVGVLFHSSSVIGIVLFGVILLANSIKKVIYKLVVIGPALIVAVFILSNWNIIGRMLIDKGILPQTYMNAIRTFELVSKGASFSVAEITLSGQIDFIFRLLFVVIPLICIVSKKNRLLTQTTQLYMYASLLGMLIYGFFYISLNTIYGYRIVMVFDYLNILFFSEIAKKRNDNSKETTVTVRQIVLFVVSFIYFYSYYIYAGAHQVRPFKFR